ncbi:MAG TPA: nuclear transport factor 2 family protein [Stenomitos sp.]
MKQQSEGSIVQVESSHHHVQSLIEKARGAWVARDIDALAALFSSNAEFIVPGQRLQGKSRIREELKKFVERYSDVNITIKRVVTEGNQAAVEWHYEDTKKATGQRNATDDVIIIEVDQGRICYWREYFDTETLSQ